MLEEKHIKKILKNIPDSLYNKVERILEEDIKKRYIDSINEELQEKEKLRKAYEEKISLTQTSPNSTTHKLLLSKFDQFKEKCLKELADVDKFIQVLKENGWDMYLSIPFLIKKHPELKKTFIDFLKRDKMIFVMHPGWNKVINEQAFKEREQWKNYSSYLKKLKKFIKRNNESALIVYFVPYNMLKKFKEMFNPQGICLVIPTKKTRPITHVKTLLNNDDELYSFLKTLTNEITFVGESLWSNLLFVKNTKEFIKKLQSDGHIFIAVHLAVHLEQNFWRHSKKVGVFDLLKFLKEASTSENLFEKYQSFFKVGIEYHQACITWLHEHLKNKYHIQTKYDPLVCYPDSPPPCGFDNLKEPY